MRIGAISLVALALAALVPAASGSRAEIRDFGIYQIDLDGSGRTKMLNNPDIRSVADLSPSRTRFLFQQAGALYSAAIDGRDVRLVVPVMEERFLGPASWSPDGRRVAFEIADESPCRPTSTGCAIGEIWLVNPDGTSLRRLATRAIAPAWSATSRRIAYIGSFFAYGESGALTVGRVRGRVRPRQIGPIEFGAWDEWAARALTWSPGGDQLAYTTVRRRGEAHGKVRVAIARANGPLRRSVRPIRAGSFGAWSPSGRRILYFEGRSHRIIRAWPDGSHRHLLTTGYGPVQWSPDGRWVAFVDEVGRGCYQMFLIRPNGTNRHQLTSEACSARFEIYWAPDSRTIDYVLTVYDP